MTSGETLGFPFKGRSLLRWFSTATRPNSSINSEGSIAATKRRLCSLAVARCNNTNGSLMHSQPSLFVTLKYGW